MPFEDCRGDEIHLAYPTPIFGSSGHEGRLGFSLKPDLDDLVAKRRGGYASTASNNTVNPQGSLTPAA